MQHVLDKVYTPDILPLLAKGQKSTRIIDGYKVNCGKQRYKLFNDNCTCVKCGIVGTELRLEVSLSKGQKYDRSAKHHFNLYAIDKDGNQVLMTIDHIVPKSKGGKNHMANYQTMCKRCNGDKGNEEDVAYDVVSYPLIEKHGPLTLTATIEDHVGSVSVICNGYTVFESEAAGHKALADTLDDTRALIPMLQSTAMAAQQTFFRRIVQKAVDLMLIMS